MEPSAHSEAKHTEETPHAFVRTIVAYWKLELGMLVAGCIIAAVYSFLLPKVYDATASVLPPQESGRGLLGSLPGPTGVGLIASPFIPGLSGSKDVFVGILKSRTMLDDVIKKFDLLKAYGVEGSKAPMRDARAMLEGGTDIRVSREGVISVTVAAGDPTLAANMANFYIDNLDRLNTTINVTEAGRTRLFLESRVAETQKALRVAEERLRVYQSESKAVAMEGQAKAAIEAAGRLEGQILAAEVQLKTMETYSTARNPDVIKLKESIDEMRRQLKRMEHGSEARGKAKRPATTGAEGRGGVSTEGDENGAEFSVPLGSIPSTGIQLARLIREAKYHETLFAALTQQLEQARMTEAKDTPTVRVLDRAVPPEWKSRPSVARNLITGGVFSFLVGVLLALVLDALRKTQTKDAKSGLA